MASESFGLLAQSACGILTLMQLPVMHWLPALLSCGHQKKKKKEMGGEHGERERKRIHFPGEQSIQADYSQPKWVPMEHVTQT